MRVLFVCSVCSFGLCLFAAGCRQTASVVDDTQNIRAAEAGLFQSIQNRDPDKTVSFYAVDVTALYDGYPPIHDRDALHAVYKEFLADKNFSFQVAPVRVDTSGNLGYTQGSLSYTSTDPASGKPVSFNGS